MGGYNDFRLLSESHPDAWPRKCEKFGVKTPIPREWIDGKSGKTYWRVRWNDASGKESVKVFGTLASITAAGAQLGWQPRIFFPDGPES